MLKLLILLIGVVILATVACGGGSDPTPASPPPPPPPVAPPPPPPPPPVAAPVTQPIVGTEVTVINRDKGGSGVVEFDPSEFSFKVGETVTFTMVGETEYHTFTVDELDIDEEVDGGETPGATTNFTHTFDRAGTFKLVCLVHELDGMVGTITVSP